MLGPNIGQVQFVLGSKVAKSTTSQSDFGTTFFLTRNNEYIYMCDITDSSLDSKEVKSTFDNFDKTIFENKFQLRHP